MLLEVLAPIGLLIVVAKLMEGVMSRFGLSSIFAHAATGVLLGPVTGIVEPTEDLLLFSGIGIFVLFFIIGIDEIDVRGFVATIRGRYFAGAIISVAVSMGAAMTVTSDLVGFGFSLDLPMTDAVALAGVLSLSSLGLVAKVLADGGHLKVPIGMKIFAVVLMAEIMSLLVVGLTIGKHSNIDGAGSAILLLVEIMAFAAAAWLLSSRVLPIVIPFLQRLLNVPQLSFGLLLGGLFIMVAGAESIGLHGTTRALLFGAALSGLPQQVRADIMPGMRSASEGLFVPLFFASAGLHFDLSFLDLPTSTIAALVIIPLLGKFAGAFIGTYAARIDAPVAMATGLMAKGVAEIAFLVVMLDTGAIGHDVFSLFVLVMLGYIFLMPPLITLTIRRVKRSDQSALPTGIAPTFARYALDGIAVGSLLDATRPLPDPSVSVSEFIDEWTIPDHDDYVVARDNRVAGIVSLASLRRLPRSERATTPLADVLRPCTLTSVPDEPISDLLERMARRGVTVVPVADPADDRLLGTVASHDVVDLVALMDEIQTQLEND